VKTDQKITTARSAGLYESDPRLVREGLEEHEGSPISNAVDSTLVQYLGGDERLLVIPTKLVPECMSRGVGIQFIFKRFWSPVSAGVTACGSYGFLKSTALTGAANRPRLPDY